MNIATVVPKPKTSKYTELQISNLQINVNIHIYLYIRASIRTKTINFMGEQKLWENDSWEENHYWGRAERGTLWDMRRYSSSQNLVEAFVGREERIPAQVQTADGFLRLAVKLQFSRNLTWHPIYQEKMCTKHLCGSGWLLVLLPQIINPPKLVPHNKYGQGPMVNYELIT